MSDHHEGNGIHMPSLSDLLFIVAGVLCMGFALMSFLVPNQFLDGGVTGISLLTHELTHVNVAYIIALANLPFVFLGYKLIGAQFAMKTLFSVVLLGLCLAFVPYPVITSDKLLISIFGGFFLGLGIGLGMRGGSALDGIEVLALYTWRRIPFTMSEIILGINVLLFLVAAFQFGLPVALYAMLTYFIATRTIDYVVDGLEEYTGVTIISGESEEIKRKLALEMGRGITIYKGERGFLKGQFDISQDTDIVFTVITRLEVKRLRGVVHAIDPKAFVFTSSIKEASGGVLKRKAVHE
jgi:uncharacterized membrane-anchored protein YitT (DUF2179 family)